MQTLRPAFVPLLLLFSAFSAITPYTITARAASKVHIVALGVARKVPYTPLDATRTLANDATRTSANDDDTSTLKIRPLMVDGRQKEWTLGDTHDVTDRSFTVRRALRVNDALPGETGSHWNWQPGPWLLVDRATGRVTALHLPDFDATISDAVWYRDYAAYCGVSATGKTLYAVVAQIGVRKAVVQKELSKWVADDHAHPACALAQWQRQPARVTFQPTGGAAMSFKVVGAASALIEEDDNSTGDDSAEP